MKSLPLTVTVTAVLPAAALAGASELMEGTGLTAVMAKVAAFEVPPPGVGLTTVTPALPAFVRSKAGISAVSCGALQEGAASAGPFQWTAEVATKSLPLTVRVIAMPAADALDGERKLSDGIGFTAVMMNVATLEVPPPGAVLITVTLALPAVVRSEPGSRAVSREGLT